MALTFQDSGNGSPLLWIHGFPHSSAIFEPQLSIGGGRHIRVDLPGFGGSPPPQADPTMASYAREIIQLLDQLGMPETTVAGISMGGYIVMEMLRQAPQRIAALMLLDTREVPDTDSAREDRVKTAADVEKNGIDALVEKMLPKMIADEAKRDSFRKIMKTATPRGAAAALRAMSTRPDSTQTLKAVKVPTLIVVGERDPITFTSDARRMGKLIRGSKVVVIPGAAHASNYDQPEEFNRAVNEFLSAAWSISRGGAGSTSIPRM